MSQASDDPFPGGFTIRDEANALVACAFRNGPLERLHQGERSPLLDDPTLSRITNAEMKILMLDACRKLTELLELKEHDTVEYDRQIKWIGLHYCRKRQWER